MISIITVNYNGLDVTLDLIQSLVSASFVGEVIVVDNGSIKNEAEVIEKIYPDLIVLRSDINLGFAGGNNLGVKYAKGEFLLFLNNDILVFPGFADGLLRRMQSNPKIGVVCPKIKFESNPQIIQYAGYTKLSRLTLRNHLIGFKQIDNGQFDSPKETHFALGAAMLVRRSVIDIVGGMPECYFLYYEELDWCNRIKEQGFSIWYEPSSFVLHKASVSVGANSPLKIYYLTRNRLIFAKRNLNGINVYISVLYQVVIIMIKMLINVWGVSGNEYLKASLKGLVHGVKFVIR